MKMIAITQRVDNVVEFQEKRDALDQKWWQLLNACKIVPIIIPNDKTLATKILQHVHVDGIILTGGYQTPERLVVELMLVEKAIKNDVPLLGVCNGMQVIQNFFGITLNKIMHHVMAEQEILIHGKPTIVNSYHNYGTTETVPELTVWAKAHDGVVKAIKHTEFPLTGVMWHPERMHPFAEHDIQLIKDVFFNARVEL